MRDERLFPLFVSVSSLKGVGAATISALARLLAYKSPLLTEKTSRAEPLLRDLLFHLPSGVIDRRAIQPISAAQDKQILTALVTIDERLPGVRRNGGGQTPYRITCHDASGTLQLVYFRYKTDYLSNAFPIGAERLISGQVEAYQHGWQMPHPDVVALPHQAAQHLRLEPIYPLAQGVTQKLLHKLVTQALARLPKELPEWIDQSLISKYGWPSFVSALQRLHQPVEMEDLAESSPTRQRLIYDEMLSYQLALALIRGNRLKQPAPRMVSEGALLRQALTHIPFTLTQGQQQTLKEISDDLASESRMLRLLQGDVGSGKTIVALLSALQVIEARYQAALMVPTEILGRQHLRSALALLEPLGLKAAILVGGMQAKERRETLAAIASGEINLVIGTHALFQEAVQFQRLGLIVIDEQHRFGVNQRLALSAKGEQPHILLMTATPIPRSLCMTAYGDMDSSILSEKPANRPRIDTRAIPLHRIDEVIEALRRAVADGNKIYWICPLVEEAEPELMPSIAGDLSAAVERFNVMTALFGDRVALAHGKMPASERAEAMRRFAGGEADILVATTVIEVGVDVPDATIIVIEHAERFGLSQLHQLRGRVGRGTKPSTCLLLYKQAGVIAGERLRIIRESDDGFRIAEEDMRLRGVGDVLGTKQSGFPAFRFADPIAHRDLISIARDDVRLLLHHDPTLTTSRGKALRLLLSLFDYDMAADAMDAG